MEKKSTFANAAMRNTLVALLGSSILATSPAFAQVPSAEGSSSGIEEIIVTATKRSESLQKVPISIQALGTQRLEQQQVKGFDDYAKLLPSVSFQSFGPGQSQIFFRGISSGGDGLHVGPLPATGLYLDEIPITTISGSVDLNIYDIARIEALSGPQGTLFGASSLSGTLRIITNKPNPDKFEGAVDLQLNKFGKGKMGGSGEGFINLPLSDRAAFRVVGFYRKDGGYIDNIPGTRTFSLSDDDPATNLTVNNSALVKKDFNDVETYGGRAALKVDLDDNWTVTPALVYQHQVTKGPFLYDPRKGDLAVTDYLPTENKDRWYQAALTIEGKIGNWDMVYSGGYFGRKTSNASDYSYYTVAYDQVPNYTNFPTGTGGFIDPTQNQILSDKYGKHTHELRVVSPSENRLRLTAGAFFQRQTDDIKADYVIKGISSIPTPLAVVPVTGYGDAVFYTRLKRTDRDYALFSELSYDVTDTIKLSGGARVFFYNNSVAGFSGFQFNVEAANCLPTALADRPCNNVDKKKVQSGETHKLNLSWQATPTALLYATYSTGFRPGGNNRRPNVDPFKADTLNNFELGWKTSLFDRRLRFNGAVFYEKWNDVQFGLSPVGSNGVTNTYNAGNARVYGIEGDVSLALGALTVSASGTYVNAKLTTDFCRTDPVTTNLLPSCSAADGTIAAAKGTRLPVQPRFKGNVTARYQINWGDRAAFVQATVNHQGGTRSFLTDLDAAAVGNTKAFTTADFSAGTTVANFSIEAFVQNAFDNRGQLGINTACATTVCGPYARVYPTKPQLFGLKVGTKF
jgi:iron complex outermembrane recepter protein